MLKASEIKVGVHLEVRKVVLVVTGTNEHGFTAEQTYKGQVHKMSIPFEVLDNPHYSQMRNVSQ